MDVRTLRYLIPRVCWLEAVFSTGRVRGSPTWLHVSTPLRRSQSAQGLVLQVRCFTTEDENARIATKLETSRCVHRLRTHLRRQRRISKHF